jgi:hydroxymethylbilane synthase
MPLSVEKLLISVGARTSPLSRVQIVEVLDELRQHHEDVDFAPHFVATVGDRDQITSLRTMGKNDFFTYELDQMVVDGRCRVAVHSAKDLPDPLPEGLAVIAVTHGIDPSDVLVLRQGETVVSLSKGAKIATSSLRREEMVRQLRRDLTFVDVRGTISQRLEKVESEKVDGVVIAEAALIRLQLTHLNRVILPGETVEGQGQLAVIARVEDEEMYQLFTSIDSR